MTNLKSSLLYNSKKLSDAEFNELLAKAKEGSLDARNKILVANMGLIYKIAGEVNLPGVEIEDLVMDGVEKFLEIIVKYDPSRSPYLSSYIWLPIRQHMYDKNRGEIPQRLLQFSCDLGRAKENLRNELEREPMDEEIASYLGISKAYLEKKYSELNVFNASSLEEMTGDSEDDNGFCLLDKNLGQFYESPAEELERKELNCQLNKVINSLPKDEKQVIQLRYLSGEKVNSLRAVASVMNSNAETIRNREKRAVSSLREKIACF